MNELLGYHEKNKNNEIFLAFYRHIQNIGKLDILAKIVKVKPDFNITNFNAEYYNELFLNNYDLEFLLHVQDILPVSILKSGIRDKEFKDKIIHFFKGRRLQFISSSLIYSESFSIEIFDRIMELFDNYEQILFFKTFYNGNTEEIDFIKKILTYPITLVNFKFVLNHFPNINFQMLKKHLKEIDKYSFKNYVETIDNSFYSSTLTLDCFFELFQKYEVLFLDSSIVNYQMQVTTFLKDENRDCYNINNIEDLMNFEEIRYNYYKIHDKDIDTITKSYFGFPFKELNFRINKYLDRNNISPFLTEEEKEKLIGFINPNDDYLNLLKINHSLLRDIKKRFSQVCKKNMSDSLFLIKKENAIINISNQMFTILAHRIKGFSNSKLATNIVLDISNWDKFYLEDSYISTSLIDQYYFGLISGSNYILGFDNVDAKAILDMGITDIYASMYLYRNNIANHNSTFDLCSFLKESSLNAYNEVTLKRFTNGKALQPNEVITFDEVTSFAREASTYFKIPIILIDSHTSASFMDEHNKELLRRKQIIEYGKYLLKMYLSFRDDYYIIAEFFDSKEMTDRFNSLMQYSDYQNELLFLVQILEKINDLNNYLAYGLPKIETEEFQLKLKKS